jgi:hypothetical protein
LPKIDQILTPKKVVSELRTLQNEAAFDYLKVENETYELLDEINKSDEILGKKVEISNPNISQFKNSKINPLDRRTRRRAQKFQRLLKPGEK